ncbi:hypothetical protein V6N13_088137 [Hibiscus sabdariffa]
MEGRKFALLSVAMAVLLLVTVAPTVMAARNEDMPFSIITGVNIRDPMADVFLVDGAGENCLASGKKCRYSAPGDCCSGTCLYLSHGIGICS